LAGLCKKRVRHETNPFRLQSTSFYEGNAQIANLSRDLDTRKIWNYLEYRRTLRAQSMFDAELLVFRGK